MRVSTAISIVVAVGVGTGIAMAPAWVVGGGVALALVVVSLRLASTSGDHFLPLLGFVLVGYGFFGRGFAYLGIAPIYVGELALAVGLISVAIRGDLRGAFRSPVLWLLLAYAAWGAARTVSDLGEYGASALRDGVIWGYGAFAALVAASFLRLGCWERVPGLYRRFFPWLLLWTPFGIMITRKFNDLLPTTPGTDTPFFGLKGGDAAVQLAGMAVFLVLGLRDPAGSPRKRWVIPEGVLWLFWAAAFVVVSSINRGGMVAIAAALLVVISLKPFGRWWKLAAVGLMVASALVVLDVEVDLGGERKISPRQVTTNILSVLDGGSSELGGTRRWRLDWWGDIVDYTLFGDHFWTGKGFGVNLADDDGFQVGGDPPLRSPHNGHLTVLARCGVPGFVLWLSLQGAFALTLLRAYRRSRAAGRQDWADLDLWILAFWMAFMMNISFDVTLEGPQGGIWFWALFGYGIAAAESQRNVEGSRELS